ncbi:DUF4158 domain-containing protein [Streptosporangium subroseum]|uniref:DUF4158 domain-containing protein n=1 Tax=Streptosporangium subroseum TaxID=106412 RepID=UPI003428DA44
MHIDELIEHWTILDEERELIAGKRGATRLTFVILLKFYTRHGRFPRGRSELPDEAIEHVAKQVQVPAIRRPGRRLRRRVAARRGPKGLCRAPVTLGCVGYLASPRVVMTVATLRNSGPSAPSWLARIGAYHDLGFSARGFVKAIVTCSNGAVRAAGVTRCERSADRPPT